MELCSLKIEKVDRFAVALTILTGFILAGFAISYLADSRDVNGEIQKEDGILENMTALFFGTAGVIFLYSMISRRSDLKVKFRDYRVLMILLGILCIFAALEEISFGQRIFGWGSPEYFEDNSTQEETDFHNFPALSIVFGIAAAVLVLYGLIIPFGLWLYPRQFLWFRRIFGIKVIYPPVQSAFVLGLGVLCIIIDYLVKFITGERFVANEYQEYLFSFGFLLFSFYLYDIRYQQQYSNLEK